MTKPDSEIYHELCEIMRRYLLELKLKGYLRETSARDLEEVKHRCYRELKPYKAHIIKALVSQGKTELLEELNLK